MSYKPIYSILNFCKEKICFITIIVNNIIIITMMIMLIIILKITFIIIIKFNPLDKDDKM